MTAEWFQVEGLRGRLLFLFSFATESWQVPRAMTRCRVDSRDRFGNFTDVGLSPATEVT